MGIVKKINELAGKSFLSTGQYTRDTVQEIVDLGLDFKRRICEYPTSLAGKVVGILLFNSSLRTRTSMAVAVSKLGGIPLVLDMANGVWPIETELGIVMDGDRPEHIKEAIPVISSYVDVLGVRCFPQLKNYDTDRLDPILNMIDQLSSVPVINLESACFHPMQSLADLMTIRELGREPSKVKVVLTWANHPRVLPMAVPNSFALACSQYGVDLTLACPKGYELDEMLMTQIEKNCQDNNTEFSIDHRQDHALSGAHVVYAKSWGSISSYGKHEEEIANRANLSNWMINTQKMSQTDDGIFMHCLPVRRNVIVSDEVIDGPQSRVLDQAKNRLYGQMAVLHNIIK